MARRRWAIVEIKVTHYVDDATFTSIRTMDLPFQHDDVNQSHSSRLTGMFMEAFVLAERAADKAWRRLNRGQVYDPSPHAKD